MLGNKHELPEGMTFEEIPERKKLVFLRFDSMPPIDARDRIVKTFNQLGKESGHVIGLLFPGMSIEEPTLSEELLEALNEQTRAIDGLCSCVAQLINELQRQPVDEQTESPTYLNGKPKAHLR